MRTFKISHDQSIKGQRRVAFVSAKWHGDIVARARESALEVLSAADTKFECFEVPGAFEIPLHAKRLAETRLYDAIIGCAFVVNGGIYRHEFVTSAVIDGLMRVQLDTGTPVFSAVLTPRDFHDHEEHRNFFAEHFVKKGVEVANACLDTLSALERLSTPRED